MKRYVAQKGDICRWPYQKVYYAQEYDGQQWSQPMDLKDLASADPAMYARVTRPDHEPERYELVHRKKRHRKTYYREKSQRVTQDAKLEVLFKEKQLKERKEQAEAFFAEVKEAFQFLEQ